MTNLNNLSSEEQTILATLLEKAGMTAGTINVTPPPFEGHKASYDLFNPTTAARVIYDGITNSKPIRIAAGETLRGVVLADHVVQTIRRDAAMGVNVDLVVTESEVDEGTRAGSATDPIIYPAGQFPQDAPPQPQAAPTAAETALKATTQALAKKNAPAAAPAPARGKKRA